MWYNIGDEKQKSCFPLTTFISFLSVTTFTNTSTNSNQNVEPLSQRNQKDSWGKGYYALSPKTMLQKTPLIRCLSDFSV